MKRSGQRMNELLFFLTLCINFTCILLAFKLLGATGLYCWMVFGTVLANIEVVKCVDLFGLSLTLGNVIYGSLFLVTDILGAKYGIRAARKAVFLGFASMVAFTVFSQINLLFEPNSADFASPALEVIFSMTPRICAASLVAYLVSNLLDTWLFHALHNCPLWVRNNISTGLSQLVDSCIFTAGAFWGVFEQGELVELFVTTYTIKLLVAVLDTPFLYLAVKKA
jgi:uncharacterized integral membrane protein (TIGR00697 family)